MKTDYALRVLFDLYKHGGEALISSRELARRNNVPIKFLEQILADLKAQQWIESVPGKHGGYRLKADPHELTVGCVVRHFEGVLAPIHCVSVNCYVQCSQEPVCDFRRLFLEVRNEIAWRMDRATMASVAAAPHPRRQEVFSSYFMYGDGI